MLRYLKGLLVVFIISTSIFVTSLWAFASTANMLRRHHHVIDVAEAQLGAAYVWGADGPSVFDCSGLALYSWRGYRSLAHNAAAQFAVLPHIAERFVMRGDLVYFDFDGGGVDHVGVLISPTRMVHASDRVEEDSLTGYYHSAIVGYRRPDRTKT